MTLYVQTGREPLPTPPALLCTAAAFQQDKRVRLYNSDSNWSLRKDVRARGLRWTITDTCLSQDQKFLLYASISPIVHLVGSWGHILLPLVCAASAMTLASQLNALGQAQATCRQRRVADASIIPIVHLVGPSGSAGRWNASLLCTLGARCKVSCGARCKVHCTPPRCSGRRSAEPPSTSLTLMQVNVGSSFDAVESIANVTEIHEALAFDTAPGSDRHGNFGIWSLRWAADGREIVAGTGDESLVIYDMEQQKVGTWGLVLLVLWGVLCCAVFVHRVCGLEPLAISDQEQQKVVNHCGCERMHGQRCRSLGAGSARLPGWACTAAEVVQQGDDCLWGSRSGELALCRLHQRGAASVLWAPLHAGHAWHCLSLRQMLGGHVGKAGLHVCLPEPLTLPQISP